MTAPVVPDILARYGQAVTGVRSTTLDWALRLWDSLGTYRDADILRLIELLEPRVRAAQSQVANLTSAYMLATLLESGEEAEAAPVDVDAILSARGVPFGQVYRRPAVAMYTALTQGKPVDTAIRMGRNRLESLVSTDLQIAKVRQSRASMDRSRAKYYRRVLKGPENCAKCIITSTLRYRKANLLPIHPGCDCDVAPIRESDPPLILDQALLEATHEQVAVFAGIENSRAEDYQDLIVTHEHGEIGPVLSWRNQNFTGPADI